MFYTLLYEKVSKVTSIVQKDCVLAADVSPPETNNINGSKYNMATSVNYCR